VRIELDESDRAMDSAPEFLILLSDRFNVVRVELNVSAFAMDVAPVYPILLSDTFNVVREESLRARRRSRSEKEGLNLLCVIICSRVGFDLEEEAMVDVYIS